MSSTPAISSFMCTIREYKTEISEAILAVIGLVATVLFAYYAVGERYTIGNDWKDKSSLAFTAYTDVGGIYVALSVASALMAVAMTIRVLVGLNAPEVRKGREIGADPLHKRGIEFNAKIAALILIYVAFFAAVYLAVQGEHTRHLTTTCDPHGKIVDDTVRSGRGDWMIVGSVMLSAVGLALAVALCFMYHFSSIRHGLSLREIHTMRGNEIGSERGSVACMDKIEEILFYHTDGEERNVSFQHFVVSGAISEAEVAFLDSIFHPYRRIKKQLAEARQDLATLPQNETRPSKHAAAQKTALEARIALLEGELEAVKEAWRTKEQEVFTGTPLQVAAAIPAPTPHIVRDIPPVVEPA